MGRDDVLAFWFGESDEVTPEVIRQSAIESLQRGETFYAHNLGLPELREAIARYTSGLHPAVDASRIAVTSRRRERADARGAGAGRCGRRSGRRDAGVAQPHGAARDHGRHVRTVPLVPAKGQWTLDLPALRAGGHVEDEAADRQRAEQPHRAGP